MPWFVSLFYYCEQNLIGNVDGTTYTVGYALKKSGTAKVLPNKTQKNVSFKIEPTNDPSTGLFTVKGYTMMWANELLCPPIYIIENKKLPKGTLDIHEAWGMGFGMDPTNNYGYLIFTDDRSLTPAYYEWYIRTILIDFVQRMREGMRLTLSDMVFVQLDGENVQIECFFNNNLRQLLNENNIVIGKSAASSTEIQQP
jgi:hypothetical protein